MIRFLRKLALFAIIILAIDILAGVVFSHWLTNITSGVLGNDNYICYHCKDDVLVFGSSRAKFHYNADLMSDSLGMSAYNCGASGQGIILSYGRLLMIKQRYQPKVIIYEVTPEFDLLKDDNHKYLSFLRTHYDQPGISEIFDEVDTSERIKMKSNLYRYNSNFLHNPLRLLKPAPENRNANGHSGFLPKTEPFDKMKLKEDREDVEERDTDPIKVHFLKKFIESASPAKVIFVASPIWYGRNPIELSASKELCAELGITFLDYSNSPKYIHQDKYFSDGSHLNQRGADEFTRDIIQQIKQQL